MINVIFIDSKTLVDADGKIFMPYVLAFKDVISKYDDVKIVNIDAKDEMQMLDYDAMLDMMSQALNLKKTLFFDKLQIDSWNDVSKDLKSWMSSKQIKSFAIVVDGRNIGDLGQAFANNVICCEKFSEAVAKDVCWILSNYKNAIEKDSKIFFTSDTHFFHANIIRYCNRPWNSGKDENGNIIVSKDDVNRMNEEIARRWNSVVEEDDIVWHLGDFSFGGKENLEKIFPLLNGKINLVMGNHDHYKIKYYYDVGFNKVYDRKVVINDFVILTHAPLMFLNENSPFFQIFGHIHDSSVYQTWSKTGCCVCVERHDYFPVPWVKIKEMYDKMNANES